MGKLYIDADACPVKNEIYRVAGRYAMRVVVVANAPLKVPTDDLVEIDLFALGSGRPMIGSRNRPNWATSSSRRIFHWPIAV